MEVTLVVRVDRVTTKMVVTSPTPIAFPSREPLLAVPLHLLLLPQEESRSD